MKIAGIIAEYNPFHNGHAWHVAETRRLTGCDYVVACMDGHFTQRGEPALFSKWNRTRMALACGVDAVFELPALYAVRTGDAFARGGVAILGGLGVDYLSFGCEVDSPETIERLAEMRETEPPSVSVEIQKGLSQGKSHARAWGEAVSAALSLPEALVNAPNLILAAEYARAIHALGFSMTSVPVRRRGGYHDTGLAEYASASAVRAAFLRGETEAARGCLPMAARPYAEPEALHPMDDLLLYRLRDMSLDALARLPDVSEGLERRLYRLCREHGTREALLSAMKCKRYTHARLSRLLTHALLGVDAGTLSDHPMPPYARLLGVRRGAEPLLTELSRRASLPIVSKAAALRDDPVFRLEYRATDLWALLHDRPKLRLPGREFAEKFVRQ